MSGYAVATRDDIINEYLRGIAPTLPAQYFIALLTTNPSDDTGTGLVEVSTANWTNYAREAIQRILAAPVAPVPTNAGTGGTVPAGVYQVQVTYVNANGETVGSAVGSTTTAGSTSTLTVPSPAASAGATGWYAYVTQAGAGTYYRQQTAGSPTAIGTGLTLTANPTTSGANPPGSNTTSGFAAPAGGTTSPQSSSNANIISHGTAATTGNQTITGFALYDAVTAGNLWYWAAFGTSPIVQNGDPVSWAAGALIVQQ